MFRPLAVQMPGNEEEQGEKGDTPGAVVGSHWMILWFNPVLPGMFYEIFRKVEVHVFTPSLLNQNIKYWPAFKPAIEMV